METATKKSITVEVTVKAPVDKVWKGFTEPKSITQWCFASDEWHAPSAENDLRQQGRFTTRMAAKDGSMGFDFGGVYTQVKEHELIEYAMDDGRMVSVTFQQEGNETRVTETFDPEATHSLEMQRGGWQAILDNFKKYVEGK